MNVNISIHDFAPILRRPEYLFRGLQQTSVDGVELVIGFKSRWSVAHYQELAHKYDIPIASLHQPLWASMGLWFDEKSFALANQLGVHHVTCHPLPKPIRDLGTITVLSPEKVKIFGEKWPGFADFLKTVKPPAALQAMHNDLSKQADVLDVKIAALVKDYDKNSSATNDKLLGELNPLTTKFGKTFADGVLKEAGDTYGKANAAYDKLDKLLKK